jgi:hypothetical protein
MKTTQADTTDYHWDKEYFDRFDRWLKTQQDSERPTELLVLDWVEENNLNAGKRFFGVSIKQADSEASLFAHQYYKWLNHKRKCEHGARMANPDRAAEYNRGFNKGYYSNYHASLDPNENDDYKIGFKEGFYEKYKDR